MQRSAGILLHPTSLPGAFRNGDLGPSARSFIHWASSAGFSWWQVLPLGPPGPGDSPYSSTSSFALSPELISLEDLVDEGLMDGDTLSGIVAGESGRDTPSALRKREILTGVFEKWKVDAGVGEKKEMEEFRALHHAWIEDWALYAALKRENGGRAFSEWAEEERDRSPDAMERARERLADTILEEVFLQFLVFRQWYRLQEEAGSSGIRFIGDLPIFVAADSADVWAHPECFLLDESRRPRVVAGVPPDYFSSTGQLWGNPLYDWDYLRSTDFSWWSFRLKHALSLTPLLRIDHFRAFAAHWEIPATAETAAEGRWVMGPGRALFDAFRSLLKIDNSESLPFIAEDLGVITDDVIRLREDLFLPGMAILQFAFSPSMDSTYLPHRHGRRLVVYTGTHDNNTIRGWLEEEAAPEERRYFFDYCQCDETEAHWGMIRAAFSSVADLAVVPFQDFFCMGSEARMNTPGRAEGNWKFRIGEQMPDGETAGGIRHLLRMYGRI